MRAARKVLENEPVSKKQRILEFFYQGVRDLRRISDEVDAKPSYVAKVLQSEGLINGYFGLYTPSAQAPDIYTDYFRNVLKFKSVEEAYESIKKLNELYRYFEEVGDHAGQHQVMVLALMGKNRARWLGKNEESEIFSTWLSSK